MNKLYQAPYYGEGGHYCPNCRRLIFIDPHQQWGEPFACFVCNSMIRFDWGDEVQGDSAFWLVKYEDDL